MMIPTIVASGTLADTSFLEAIARASRVEGAVILEVARDTGRRSFWFREGRLVGLITSSRSESLPSILVRRNKIQQTVADSIQGLADTEGITPAQVIMRDRVVPLPELVTEMNLWATLLVLETFGWEDADWRIIRETADMMPPATLLELKLPAIMHKGVVKRVSGDDARALLRPWAERRAAGGRGGGRGGGGGPPPRRPVALPRGRVRLRRQRADLLGLARRGSHGLRGARIPVHRPGLRRPADVADDARADADLRRAVDHRGGSADDGLGRRTGAASARPLGLRERRQQRRRLLRDPVPAPRLRRARGHLRHVPRGHAGDARGGRQHPGRQGGQRRHRPRRRLRGGRHRPGGDEPRRAVRRARPGRLPGARAAPGPGRAAPPPRPRPRAPRRRPSRPTTPGARRPPARTSGPSRSSPPSPPTRPPAAPARSSNRKTGAA